MQDENNEALAVAAHDGAPTTGMTAPSSPKPSQRPEDELWSWAKVRDAFRRDWEQTKADFSSQDGQRLNQSAGDTLNQALGWQPLPAPGEKSHPSDAKETQRELERAQQRARKAEAAIVGAKTGIAEEHARLSEKIKAAHHELVELADQAHGKIAIAQDEAVDGIQKERARISAAVAHREEALAEWDKIEQEARFGYAERARRPEASEWNAALEAELQSKWDVLRTGRSWAESRHGVQRGWDYQEPRSRKPADPEPQ